MKPVPFDDIATLENNFPIACVEGKLVKLYDNKPAKGTTANGEWTRYDGVISDGKKEFKISFWMDTLPPVVKFNAHIRIVHGTDKKNKPAGLSKSVNEKNGTTYHAIKVDDRAIISLAGSDSGAPEPQSAPKSQSAAQTPPQRAYEGNAGHPEERVCFDTALADYRRAFCKVCVAFGHPDPELEMAALTAEKLAEITTCVSMASTRGQYGRYIGYWFAEDKEDVGPSREELKEGLLDTASDAPSDDFGAETKSALDTFKDRLRAHPEWDVLLKPKAVNAVVKAKFGCEVNQLTPAQAVNALKAFNEIVETAVEPF